MSFCSGCPSDESKVMEIKNPPVKKGETLVVTKKAAGFIGGLMEKQAKKGWGLRLEAIPGGCAGYKYFMGFQEKPADDDTTVESHGIKVFISGESLELIRGSEIDFIETLEASGLKVNNPNATRGCGCGKSFG